MGPDSERRESLISLRERQTIVRLSRAAEYRDWDSPAHLERVSAYARLIACRMGRPSAECELVFQAAPMHDVGKIGIPDRILLKSGPLTADEFDLVKQHSVLGHHLLRGSDVELLETAATIALTHHERFDGSGYPNGASGEAIALPGRIVAVADTFDVLTSNRPYKDAWPVPLAWAWLHNQAGTHFDPACVAAFQDGESEVEAIRARYPDGPDTPGP